MRFFKYMPRRYLEAFFRRGSIKIGSLYEYRKTEHYGNVVGDKNEGLHMTELSFEGDREIDLAEDCPEANFFKKNILRPDQQGIKNVSIKIESGTRLIALSHSSDRYIYCMSSEYNPQVMKQFGCDACMEIINPEAFFSALSRRIRHQGNFDGCFDVQYMSKLTHYTMPHKLHPAIMKEVEFAYQKELRAIWAPHKPLSQPIFINVPKAVRHCRVIKS